MKSGTTALEQARREPGFAEFLAELRRFNAEMKRWDKKRREDWKEINRARKRTRALLAELRASWACGPASCAWWPAG
jgi:hypothetical protein